MATSHEQRLPWDQGQRHAPPDGRRVRLFLEKVKKILSGSELGHAPGFTSGLEDSKYADSFRTIWENMEPRLVAFPWDERVKKQAIRHCWACWLKPGFPSDRFMDVLVSVYLGGAIYRLLTLSITSKENGKMKRSLTC
jgi:hypothetical protein